MRSIVTRSSLLLLTGLTLTAPAGAGVRYETLTRTSDGDRSVQRIEVDGPKTRIDFLAGGQGAFGKSTYLISQDSGDHVVWVEPKKKRAAEVDLDAMARVAGRLMEGIPGIFWLKIEEPRIEKVFEEEAEPLFGLPVRHARFVMTYEDRSRVTLPAKKGITSTRDKTYHQVVQDVWFTEALAVPGAEFWIRPRFQSGYRDLDRFLAAENRLTRGFPLRIETVEVAATHDLERSRLRLGKSRTSLEQSFYLGSGRLRRGSVEFEKKTVVVTFLEVSDRPIPSERFEVPRGFERRTRGGDRVAHRAAAGSRR